MQGHSAAETQVFVPHRGSLCRFPDEHGVVFYAIEIRVVDEEQHSQQQQQQQPPLPLPLLLYNVHELIFSRHDFEFCSNLFAICDTQNRGLLDRSAVLEFATLRCPVFWRRDEDFSYQQQQQQQHAHDTTHTTNTNTNTSRTTTTGSPTFDEIWKAVVSCSQVTPPSQQQQQQDDDDDDDTVVNVVELGVEAWMVFCRFVCLAQYLEAKRRFSARHLQQTMRHRNAPRGSEVVVVDVPPPTPPIAITPERLCQTERGASDNNSNNNNNKNRPGGGGGGGVVQPLPLPELDLDHSLLAAHELYYRSNNSNNNNNNSTNNDTTGSTTTSWNLRNQNQNGTVRIELFGACSSAASKAAASAVSSSSSASVSSTVSSATVAAAAAGLLPSSSSGSSKDASSLEFAVTFTRGSGGGRRRPLSSPSSVAAAASSSSSSMGEHVVVVRRSMADMKWLDDTFTSHKVLGGTLCGRILPPFPGSSSPWKNHRRRSAWNNRYYNAACGGGRADDSSASSILKTSTNGAIAAATAGVGKIRKVAKSWLFGLSTTSSSNVMQQHPSSSSTSTSTNSMNTLTREERGSASAAAAATTPTSTTPTLESPSSSSSSKKQAHAFKMLSSKSSTSSTYYPLYNPNSPLGQARQLERYLNYLLEHPALSTSFPLNTILTASQSGLDAARKALEECTRASNQLSDQTPHLDDGSSPYCGGSAGMGSGGGTGTAADLASSPNFAWVRTAAQAAMALRVHGMLETTGMLSASARLQDASLPAFAGGSCRRAGRRGWEDDDHPSQQAYPVTTVNATMLCGDHEQLPSSMAHASEFEVGVISVESELVSDAPPEASAAFVDDDYDLLPLPVPAPERRILNAGISCVQSNADSSNRQERFYYGTSDYTTTVQGTLWSSADDDGRSSSVLLGSISVDENIDKLREVIGSADNILSRCLMASGAVGAARYERQAVQLDIVRGLDSWQGMRGKFVNQIKLMKGVAGIEQSKEIYEESDLVLVDDISWQTSLASAAVGAAEDVRSAVRAARTAANAKAAASAAAMAAQTACDRGAFATFDEAQAAQTRSSIAQSHAIHAAVVEHEAKAVKRRATLALAHDVKCWNVHRKREMLKSCVAFAKAQHEATRRAVDAWSSLSDGFIRSTVIPSAAERRIVSVPTPPRPTHHIRTDRDLSDSGEEVTARIYGNGKSATSESHPTIVAIDHKLFAPSPPQEESSRPPATGISEDEEMAKTATGLCQDLILPFATASPILEGEEDDEDGGLDKGGEEGSLADSKLQQQQQQQQQNKHHQQQQQQIQREQDKESSSQFGSSFLEQQQQVSQQQHLESSSYYESTHSFLDQQDSTTTFEGENQVLSESMQSLVNGLMTWGGGLDADEDHFALPAGLAASIAMEGAMGPS